MAKTIELHFNTNLGKVAKLSVENPIEPIDPVKVKEAMDTIVAANVFGGKSGTLSVQKKHVLLNIM